MKYKFLQVVNTAQKRNSKTKIGSNWHWCYRQKMDKKLFSSIQKILTSVSVFIFWFDHCIVVLCKMHLGDLGEGYMAILCIIFSSF